MFENAVKVLRNKIKITLNTLYCECNEGCVVFQTDEAGEVHNYANLRNKQCF